MTGRDVARWVWLPFGVVVRFIMRSGKRIAVTVVGLFLLLAGLAVLATEYVWAERVLTMAKDKARQARDRATGRRRVP